MKLGELRGLIRKTKGNPYVNVFPFPGTDKGFRFHLQKTPLLEELDRVYPGGKSVETGLEFNVDTGCLKSEGYDEAVGLNTEEKTAAFSSDEDLLDLDTSPAPAPSSDLGDLLV